jgi:hypothetical protein
VFIEDIVPSSDQNRRDLMAGSWGKMPHTTNAGTPYAALLFCSSRQWRWFSILIAIHHAKFRNFSIVATKSLIDSS